MAFKTILVSLNDVGRAPSILSAATVISRRHDAHVIGLYVAPAVRIHPAVQVNMTPDLLGLQQDHYKSESRKAKKIFEDALRAEGVAGEWRHVASLTPNIADAVIEHGREADLIIAGQVDHQGDNGLEPDFDERVTLGAGRPVLMIPLAGEFKTIGEQVVVGWNATREAARAVFDAIPLMARARQIHLVWVDPQRDADSAGDLPGSELAAALSRHGLKVTAEKTQAAGIGVGEVLLNRVSDHGADLLVMGAYGHSRVREFIFGGASRSVLHHMTVPVLLSN